MTLINFRDYRKNGQVFEKQFSSKEKMLAEFHALNYLNFTAIINVPRILDFHPENLNITYEYIDGILLLDLLRRIERSAIRSNNLKSRENAEKTILGLVEKALSDLSLFHRYTNEISLTFPPGLQKTYPYKQNLLKTIYLISQICEVNILDITLLNRAIDLIGDELEKQSSVICRDAGLYNIIVKISDQSAVQWIRHIMELDPVTASTVIWEQSYHVDFATANYLICPFDDYSAILYSSVVNKSKLLAIESFFPELNLSTKVYAGIYRFLRTSARHFEYLYKSPHIYKERYQQYGSIVDESPIYYLDMALFLIEQKLGHMRNFVPLYEFLLTVKQSQIQSALKIISKLADSDNRSSI